jgi:3D (Asp-Asp-Asp) domain-containing protein
MEERRTVTRATKRGTKTARSVKRAVIVAQPRVGSAAADWSRWPAGTSFRLLSTGQIYRVDDYGWALAGRNTIDLYMPNQREMNSWGARQETIQIVQWGDPQQSLLYTNFIYNDPKVLRFPDPILISGSAPIADRALTYCARYDNGDVEAPVVFAGYGIVVPDGQDFGYDSYAGLDVKDKIVLVLRYFPEDADRKYSVRELLEGVRDDSTRRRRHAKGRDTALDVLDGAAAPRPVRPTGSPYRGKVDFGILTIREDENAAVVRRFAKVATEKRQRWYRISSLALPGGSAPSGTTPA